MRTKKNLEKFFRDVFALAKQVYSCVTGENSQTERVRVSDIRPGMYVYEDNSIRSKIIKGHQIKAVVGYVEKGTVYAVCLREANMPWSSDCLFVEETRNMSSGKEATLKILETAETSGKTAEAAQWCHEYDYDGVKKGEAFLPSLDELRKLCKSKGAINKALKKLRAKLLRRKIWSSSDISINMVWSQYFDDGNVYCYSSKYFYGYVRAVLILKLS